MLQASRTRSASKSPVLKFKERVMRNHFFAATLFAVAMLQIVMIAGVLIR
jgi:hypothetical protein